VNESADKINDPVSHKRRGLSSGTRGDEIDDLTDGLDALLLRDAAWPVEYAAVPFAKSRNRRFAGIQKDERRSDVRAVHERLFQLMSDLSCDDRVDVPLQEVRRRVEVVHGEGEPAVAGNVHLMWTLDLRPMHQSFRLRR
jgi:hypothetical protein